MDDLVNRLRQCLPNDPSHTHRLPTLDMVREAADRIEALEAENFALAANQCRYGVSGEHGDHVCSRIEALEKALRDAKHGYVHAHLR